MEADRVVVELIARTEGFDGKMKASTAGFESSMGRIQTAATNAEKTVASSSDARIAAIRKESAQISQFSKMLGGQINDVGNLMVSNKSPFVVPVKQAPLVSNAMKLIVTGASAVGSVMGGFLVTSVLAGASALVEFIMKSGDAESKIRDLVESLKEEAHQTDLARKAKVEFGNTIEGVTEALADNQEALDKLATADRSAAFQAAVNAEKQRLKTVDIRENTVALIENAKAQLEVLRVQQAQNGGSLRETGVNSEIALIQQRIAALDTALGKAKEQEAIAKQQFATALSRAAVERGSEDELSRIRRKADEAAETARQRILADGQKRKLSEQAITREIIKQTEAIRAQQKIDEEAARKRNQVDHSNDQAGRQINEAQARAIVASIGGTVTSGTRTAQHNKDVGGVPNSFHVKGQALDIAKTAGITLGKIVKAFEAQGVRLIEKLDEGDHFHIAFGKRGGSGPSAETLAKRAAAAAIEAERREQAFQNEKGTLDQQVIDARQALVTSAEEIAKLELEAIEKSRVQYNEKLASLVEQNKISGGTKGLLQQEATELQKLNDERARLRADLVRQREEQRKFRIREADAQRALTLEVGTKSVEAELLQSQQGLADTAKQRHAIERKLLDLQFEMERIQLEAIVAEYERLKIKQDLTDAERQELEDKKVQADLAQERLGTLPDRQANANTGNDLGNASPLEDFFNRIPDSAPEINEALESIAAGGLQSLTDGLTEAILGMRSFGDVGRAVLQQVLAGLIKLGIQQLLLHTIGATLGSAAVGTAAAQAAVAGAAWAPAAALASLATLGANAGPAAAALTGTTALATALAIPKGFLSGGYTGDGPVGAPAGIVHGKEYVFDAAATNRIGVHNLEAMRKGVRPSNARAAQPGGRGAGGFDNAKLQAIVDSAIRAMPPVQLFPTFDPVTSMEAALNDNRGRRVLLDFMGNNRGAVGGTLQP